MSVHTIEPVTRSRVDIRTVDRESYTEFYVTGSVEEASTTPDAVEAQFSEVAALLAERKIQPIVEKVYGRTSIRNEVLAIRAKTFKRLGLDHRRPLTYVEGQPARGSDFAGVQIWGVSPRDPSATIVLTVAHDGAPAARYCTAPGYRVLYLPDVDGMRSDGTLPSCPTGQAKQMFENARAALEANGFAYTQVIRTWIYLSRLLDWYGEFNRVRTAHHANVGLQGGAGEAVFPASTGIQGKSLGRECFMDLLALDGAGTEQVNIEPIRGSRRQPPAFSYGSAFSRGTCVEIEGRKTIHVSGTASIDPGGRSVHIGDAEGQSVETLLNVAALLEQHGGGLENICSATLFCKNEEAFEAYRTVTQLMHAPSFPTVAVIADVCREDLLVEVEAVAVI